MACTADFSVVLNKGDSEVWLCRAHLAYGLTRYADKGDVIECAPAQEIKGCMGGALNWPESADSRTPDPVTGAFNLNLPARGLGS